MTPDYLAGGCHADFREQDDFISSPTKKLGDRYAVWHPSTPSSLCGLLTWLNNPVAFDSAQNSLSTAILGALWNLCVHLWCTVCASLSSLWGQKLHLNHLCLSAFVHPLFIHIGAFSWVNQWASGNRELWDTLEVFPLWIFFIFIFCHKK